MRTAQTPRSQMTLTSSSAAFPSPPESVRVKKRGHEVRALRVRAWILDSAPRPPLDNDSFCLLWCGGAVCPEPACPP